MKGLKPLSQYLCRKRRLEVNLKKLKEIKRNYWVQLQFNQVTLALKKLLLVVVDIGKRNGVSRIFIDAISFLHLRRHFGSVGVIALKLINIKLGFFFISPRTEYNN